MQRKKSNGGDFEELDEWKDEFMFLRKEFDNIRHPTPIRITSEEVMQEPGD
jgi:hypothetical protein